MGGRHSGRRLSKIAGRVKISGELRARARLLADPQIILALIIMAWPVLYFVKQDQDVFHWPSVVQHLLVASLVLVAARQPDWQALQAGQERPIWHLFWALVLYLTIATLVHSPVFVNGIAGFVKHLQFLPLLVVGGSIGVRASLWRRCYAPYLMVLIVALALPAVLAAAGFSRPLLQSVCQAVGLACPGTAVRYEFGFGNPNQLATFLVGAMLMTLFLRLPDLHRPSVLLPTLSAVSAGAFAVVLTFSGRVWMILPVALLLGVALQRSRRRRIWLTAGLVMVIVLSLAYIRMRDPQTADRLALFTPSGVARELAGLKSRLTFWEQIVSYVNTPAKVLFGVGAGTLGYATRSYLNIGYRTVDGYYAVMLGEYGLVGLILYIALVAAIVRRLMQRILSRTLRPVDEQIVTALLLGVAVVLLAGLVGNANSSFPLGMNLWCFLGCALALSRGTPMDVRSNA